LYRNPAPLAELGMPLPPLYNNYAHLVKTPFFPPSPPPKRIPKQPSSSLPSSNSPFPPIHLAPPDPSSTSVGPKLIPLPGERTTEHKRKLLSALVDAFHPRRDDVRSITKLT
ncbi:hypothetical protein AMTR_s00076p00189950, partial [Amborella trichopoda]